MATLRDSQRSLTAFILQRVIYCSVALFICWINLLFTSCIVTSAADKPGSTLSQQPLAVSPARMTDTVKAKSPILATAKYLKPLIYRYNSISS
ncbi:hypothetical protein [Nostoc sp. FACHB-133]|uniref:hypothetical protein n=1 Tax=unclassified Nostoc TaxID=2593658 RepID=UPI001685207E|nr:hypothetical protein [Nostoc sp. FACHB-133]MBD2526907.1 hypothetical protein [Nostoc sp. FACHB-133]